MDNIKKRLLKYIDYKGVSRREFCRVIGVSPTFLANDSEIGSNKLINIFSSYPDLSMSWLIMEDGEMLKQNEIKQNDTEPNAEVFQLRAENCLLKEMLKDREGQISTLNIEVGKLQERVSSFRLQDGESTGQIGLSGGGGGLPMPVDAPA
ncbi:MAG: hypothetical protein LIP00_10495, partial [Parabacteroides sp.]|nr:hypothetical protein [Parabacteroides sp.]